MEVGYFYRISFLSGQTPKRIISLVPSQTELLYDLGLRNEVVGITKFCVHPKIWFNSKNRIGGTKTINFEKVTQLKPDLIIANKEENIKVQVEQLSKIAPVWVTDVNTFEDALKMIDEIGTLVNKKERAAELIQTITNEFKQLKTINRKIKTVAYFIWFQPWMAVGKNTFIHNLFSFLGLKNVFENQLRYPEVTLEELKKLCPDVILLSSEPFPFKEKQATLIRKILPQSKIHFVDGEMFSWYGSRLQLTSDYFKKLEL